MGVKPKAAKKPRKSKTRNSWNQAAVTRMHQAWEMYCLGLSYNAIATRLGTHWDTARSDVKRAREMSTEAGLAMVDERRVDAIRTRRSLMLLALKDRAKTAYQHRAPLLKEARENQTGIEELGGLREKEEAPSAQAGVFLIQVGEQAPKAIKDLSDDELAQLVAVSDEEIEKLAEGEG